MDEYNKNDKGLFLSVINLNWQLFYLTNRELKTYKGKEFLGLDENFLISNIPWHDAIDCYYGLNGQGERHIYHDLSKPDDLPVELVNDIKYGAFEGIGYNLELLVEDVRFGIFHNKLSQAWDIRNIRIERAIERYQEIHSKNIVIEDCHSAYDQYDLVKSLYPKQCKRNEIEILNAHDSLSDEIKKIYIDFERTEISEFWLLFRDPDNRIEAWK